LLTNCVAVLDRYPALQAVLHERPELIPAFVEETLRCDSPAKNLSRQTVTDVTLAGVTIPADSRVMILMASANRDERVFEHPDRLDLGRQVGSENKVYCCGPAPLLAAVESRVTPTWPHGSLQVERFSPRPLTEPVLREAFEVRLARHGGTVTVTPDVSVLAALDVAGVPVLSSCAEGTCGTCGTTVLEGVPDHRDSVLSDPGW
jgi:hypothetical protein